MSSEGARVAVRFAAALGKAGERLRRPDEESKLFSCFIMDGKTSTVRNAGHRPWPGLDNTLKTHYEN